MLIRSLFCATCGDRFLSFNKEKICKKCAKKTKKLVPAVPTLVEPVQTVQQIPEKEEQTAFRVLEGAKAVCPQCGKEFVRGKQLNKVYCSRACKENAKKHRNWQEQNNHEVKPAPVIALPKKEISKPRKDTVLHCEFCGTEFKPINSRQRFCCCRCQEKAANLRINRTCAGCGKIFHTASDRTKYCTECQLKLFGQMTAIQHRQQLGERDFAAVLTTREKNALLPKTGNNKPVKTMG